jgi:hypothetical protein
MTEALTQSLGAMTTSSPSKPSTPSHEHAHYPLNPKEEVADNEKPILAEVLQIRGRLVELKKNRAAYIKGQDVVMLHNQVDRQIALLNDIRKNEGKEKEVNQGEQRVRSL